MKIQFPPFSFRPVPFAVLLLAFFSTSACSRQIEVPASSHATVGDLIPVGASTDSTWLARARADYPLDHCPVCGDKLDSKSPEYVYRQPGQPDQLLRFCDEEECVASFRKDPAKYLGMINAASTARTGHHQPD